MGTRGPIPKRSEDRRRRNKPVIDVARAASGREWSARDVAEGIFPPGPQMGWSTAAKGLWKSAASSGQSRFYEASDWWMLWTLCDELSAYQDRPIRNAQLFSTLLTGFSNLLVTEGDRRRVAVELVRAREGYEESAGTGEVVEWARALKAKKAK